MRGTLGYILRKCVHWVDLPVGCLARGLPAQMHRLTDQERLVEGE